MRIFKNLKTAAMVSILIASFMFLLPGAGGSLADGYAGHSRSAGNHGYQNNPALHRGNQVTRRVVTTTRYYAPLGVKQRHADTHCSTNVSRHQRAGKKHMARNSFKHHQKLRQSNFRAQRHSQQHVRHNLGLFAALPGIIVNIPL